MPELSIKTSGLSHFAFHAGPDLGFVYQSQELNLQSTLDNRVW